jgi:leucyl aminopeptidase
MNLTVKDKIALQKSAILFFVTQEGWEKKKNFSGHPRFVKESLQSIHKAKLFKGSSGEVFSSFLKESGAVLVVVGLGKEKTLSPTAVMRAAKGALEKAGSLPGIQAVPHKDDTKTVQALAYGLLLGGYKWKKYLSSKKDKKQRAQIITKHKGTVRRAARFAAGVTVARDLVNDNADEIHSVFMEKKMRDLVRGKKNVRMKVVNEKDMKELGMNLFLGVNRASAYPPKLLIAAYKGDPKSKAYTLFLGKCLTYDSGGLNLKPTGSLETMRTDMSGAAAVLGTLRNILDFKPKKNILFACAAAENAIGPKAQKPGDVVRSYSGKTVEIGNTDAEGRLVLADSISYLTDKYNVETVIDIATLTGAVVIALGKEYTGLMANDDALAESLLSCAGETDDRAWRLPMYPELKEHIKSSYADIKSTGRPREAGTISAAEFLRQFVPEGVKWAHLDIAGTSFMKASHWYFNYGGTGAGVRLVTEYLLR